jgi:hypothetical protein
MQKGRRCSLQCPTFPVTVPHIMRPDPAVCALRDLEAAMKEGALVPTGVTVGLLRGAMLRSGGARFLIDGFPRAVEQARPWRGVNRVAAALGA